MYDMTLTERLRFVVSIRQRQPAPPEVVSMKVSGD